MSKKTSTQKKIKVAENVIGDALTVAANLIWKQCV